MSEQLPQKEPEEQLYQTSFGKQELADDVDLAPYTGRWVAVAGKRVAGVGETAMAAENMGRRNRIRERLSVYFVEPLRGEPISMPHLFEKIRPILINQQLPIYLVGGAIRDLLLGLDTKDFDFVVPRNAVQIAFRVANQLNVPAFVLDQERDTGRVVLADYSTTLDFTSFRGPDLEADLRARDFTVNAIALPVAARNQSSLIDPCEAISDIHEKSIRICYPEAIEDDPVRSLRAIRLIVETGFTPTPETVVAVSKAIHLLDLVSAERVRDELLKLLSADQPGHALELLHDWQVLPEVLPEINQLQFYNRTELGEGNLLNRTGLVLDSLVALESIILEEKLAACHIPAGKMVRLKQTFERLNPFREELAAYFDRQVDGNLDRWLLLRMSGLFFYVGSASSVGEDPDSGNMFPITPPQADKTISTALKQLRLSNNAVTHVKDCVSESSRLIALLDRSEVDRRAAYRFFRDTNDVGVDICILTLADFINLNHEKDNDTAWRNLLAVVDQLLDFYFNQFNTTIQPLPLVDGMDILALLTLEPGPEVGRLLRLIEEAQAAGEVTNREQALALARREVKVQ